MNKHVAAAVATAAIAVAVTGCRADDHAGSSANSPVVESTQAPTTASASTVPSNSVVAETTAATGTSSPDFPASGGRGQCLDLASPVVVNAVNAIDSYYGNEFYVDHATRAELGSCPDLMWAVADLEGGTGSSPQRVLFFDADGFVRYDTEVNTAFTSVVGSTNDSVTVGYRWLADGDATANPTGGPVNVTYTLSGQNVIADRAVPEQALAG